MHNQITNVIFVLSVIFVIQIYASDLGRGFNERIDWVNLEDGLKLAKDQNKPVMVLVHKSWCGACKALAPKFAVSQQIEDLSKEFIMVNIRDEEEPSDQKYYPDGGYIPRVLFLDPNGEVNKDLINEKGSQQYKYYYPEPSNILETMKKSLELHKNTKQQTDEL